MLKIQYNSPVILTFSLIAAVVFFLGEIFGREIMGYFSAPPVFDTSSLSRILALVTYPLGHANLDHIMGNLTFILLLGPIIEEKYGARNLFAMMFLTTIATSLINIIFFNTGIIGASGIVFMFIVVVSFVNVERGKIPITFILIVVLYLGKEVMNSMNADNISQFGHIMGGLCGSVFGFIIRPKNGGASAVAESV